MTRRTLALTLGAVALSFGRVALAQDSVAAQALFDRGVSDMDAGRYEKACPALAESERLEPRPGTLFALAECENKWGKLASAAAHYQDYVDVVSRLSAEQQARHAERAETARGQLAALRDKVPTLTLKAPQALPPGTVIQRDGAVLQAAALELALPVDPGEHVISLRTPGHAEQRTSVALAPGENKIVELSLPSLTNNEAAPPVPPMVESKPNRAVPLALGAVGVAGMIAGSVTGILALNKKSVIEDHCDGLRCDSKGKSAADSAQNLALVSSVAFGVGIAGLAAGVVLWVTDKPAESSRAGVKPLFVATPSASFLGVSGKF